MAGNDTTPEARGVQYEIYRQMPVTHKMQLVFDGYRTRKLLSTAGLGQRDPSASDEEIRHMWAGQHLGNELYNEVYGTANGEDRAISGSKRSE